MLIWWPSEDVKEEIKHVSLQHKESLSLGLKIGRSSLRDIIWNQGTGEDNLGCGSRWEQEEGWGINLGASQH